jgi:hypothetical protein
VHRLSVDILSIATRSEMKDVRRIRMISAAIDVHRKVTGMSAAACRIARSPLFH